MIATYEQSTGRFTVSDGERLVYKASGHAGRDNGRNSPAHERERGLGPLPAGMYRMRLLEGHRRFRKPVWSLHPYPGVQMHGRSAFLVHGGTISHGCIILDRAARLAVAELKPATLLVVAGKPQ